ncbi:Regulator of telomere elongation helicase 1 [Gonapodya sp. JEL0774]|nr:Regulator of telomere elongation helicase 1 [Gonapodya sp. JEL0774]
MKHQKQLDLRGVQTLFPFEPYRVQVDLMERAILSLQSRRNALLESPTGTGKTLCLLCSVLAWREHYAALSQLKASLAATNLGDGRSKPEIDMEEAKKMLEELDRAVGETFDGEDQFIFHHKRDDPPDPPKIYYASRTHTQLSNCLRELRNTGYRPRTSILASREQLCLDDSVREARSNAAKASMCRQKVTKRECRWHAGVESVVKQGWMEGRANIADNHGVESEDTAPHQEGPSDGAPVELSQATPLLLDVEDLVAFGRERGACPYFLSRENQPRADITFLPYQYLLDPHARKAQGLDLRGAIVIFDEAHNLESVCGDTTSFEISTADLAACADEARQCADYATKPGYAGEQTKEDFEILEVLVGKLASHLQSLPLNPSSGDFVRPGDYIFDLFAAVKVSFETWEVLGRVLEGAVQTLAQVSASGSHRRSPRAHLSALHTALKTCFHPSLRHLDRPALASALHAYRVHLTRAGAVRGGGEGRTLSYWCFDSGVAMRELLAAGVRNVILASGTLAPLDGVAAELGIPFDVRLENPHVITDSQALVAVVTKGPAGTALNSSYQRRDDTGYRTDLGNAVVNFARTVPDGILCFFPSYGVMQSCIDSWKSTSLTATRSILDRIQSYKHIVVEPQSKAEFSRAIEYFYAMVETPGGSAAAASESSSIESQSSGSQTTQTQTGAILFAVCRGKVSEGVDFSDAKARGVIVTGLPFPAAKDPKHLAIGELATFTVLLFVDRIITFHSGSNPQVSLKKQFLDDSRSRNRTGIDGATWYRQQASRAVNQAIGRAIRHRSDYGAILLLDDRFASAPSLAALPAWVKPRVTVHNSFATVQGGLSRFFRAHADEKVKAPVGKSLSGGNSSSTAVSVVGMNMSVATRIAAVRHMTALSAGSATTRLQTTAQIRPSNHATTYEKALRALAEVEGVVAAGEGGVDDLQTGKSFEPALSLHSTTQQVRGTLKEIVARTREDKVAKSAIVGVHSEVGETKENLPGKAGRMEVKPSEAVGSVLDERKAQCNPPTQARTYLDDVKATLSRSDYKKLQAFLRAFKAKELDFWKLVDELEMLLSCYDAIFDLATLQAAILHDTVEDTDTTREELVQEFGDEVVRLKSISSTSVVLVMTSFAPQTFLNKASIVMEVTDNKDLPKETRKSLQVSSAPHKSLKAKHVKMADKLFNLRDLQKSWPEGW